MQYLTPALYLLSLLVVIVNSQQGDYQKFLNHGFKSGQMSKELSKLKVDVLGKVLKKHVTQLRSGNQYIFVVQLYKLQGINSNKLQTKVLTFLSRHFQWTAKVLAAVSLKERILMFTTCHFDFPRRRGGPCVPGRLERLSWSGELLQ